MLNSGVLKFECAQYLMRFATLTIFEMWSCFETICTG